MKGEEFQVRVRIKGVQMVKKGGRSSVRVRAVISQLIFEEEKKSDGGDSGAAGSTDGTTLFHPFSTVTVLNAGADAD